MGGGPDFDHHFPVGGELDGIADEVDENLPQARDIADEDFGDAVIHAVGKVEFLLRRLGRKQVQRFLEAGVQFERVMLQFEFARLDLREVEDVVDDGQQRVGAAAGGFDCTHSTGGQGHPAHSRARIPRDTAHSGAWPPISATPACSPQEAGGPGKRASRRCLPGAGRALETHGTHPAQLADSERLLTTAMRDAELARRNDARADTLDRMHLRTAALRNAEQQRWIAQGLRTGHLSPTQAAHLERTQAELAAAQATVVDRRRRWMPRWVCSIVRTCRTGQSPALAHRAV